MELKAGYYRHYKGNLYEVLHTARDSETERWVVVYRALYGEYGLWVRDYEMFVEKVEVDGILVDRFAFEEEISEPKICIRNHESNIHHRTDSMCKKIID